MYLFNTTAQIYHTLRVLTCGDKFYNIIILNINVCATMWGVFNSILYYIGIIVEC